MIRTENIQIRNRMIQPRNGSEPLAHLHTWALVGISRPMFHKPNSNPTRTQLEPNSNRILETPWKPEAGSARLKGIPLRSNQSDKKHTRTWRRYDLPPSLPLVNNNNLILMGGGNPQPETVPQAIIDMNRVVEVSEAEEVTGHSMSLALTAADRVHFLKGTSPEESKWWFDILSMFPSTNMKV